ncbi:MAG: hypothetical protein QME12_07385 [Nanoarchaeota archaeon]|nr:hypothetical protein [Nanoarchaeota archaeon]
MKIIPIFIIPIFIIALMAFSASALAVDTQPPSIIVKPCSWLYSFKIAFENVKINFLSDENELLYRADLANKRLEEARLLPELSCTLSLEEVELKRAEQIGYIDLLLDRKFTSLSTATKDKLVSKLEWHKLRSEQSEYMNLSPENSGVQQPLGLLRAIEVHEIAQERFSEKVSTKAVAVKAQSVSALDKLKQRVLG